LASFKSGHQAIEDEGVNFMGLGESDANEGEILVKGKKKEGMQTGKRVFS